jgi:pimeloyl-ACP methyl ester carboxylesterase
MIQFRSYGNKPFEIAVVHGGPGAPGEMAPIARKLATLKGTIEPFQTALTIRQQLQELKQILDKFSNLPILLIGFSWGALLSFIFSAEYPKHVKKLILVSSAVYETKYAANILNTRLSRLDSPDRNELIFISNALNNSTVKEKGEIMKRLAKLIAKSDSYNPIPHTDEILEYQYDIYISIWNEASNLRKSGKLLEYSKKIICPVVAIHGDYDPHPYKGVKVPLSRMVNDFRFFLLRNCGHYPWWEREAHDQFYKLLITEISDLSD